MTDDRAVRSTVRVRYHECDMQGVVFNAVYLAYADMACTEYWRVAAGSYGALTSRGYDAAVVSAHLEFRAPARFDEEVELAVSVSRIGRTSFDLDTRMTREGELLAETTVTYVFFKIDAPGASVEPPDEIRAMLTRTAVEDPA